MTMAKKHNNLYLWLALVCFLAIVLVFIFDGYLGVYDTATVNNGEYENVIGGEDWPEFGGYYTAGVVQGGKLSFEYKVDNRWFSSYSDNVAVSVWHNNEKVADILATTVATDAFSSQKIEWTVDSTLLVPADAEMDYGYQFFVKIHRSDIERNIIINIIPAGVPIKEIPVPVRG